MSSMLIAFWVLFVTAMIIITLSFVMAPESNSFSGALVGSSDLDLFKQSRERGSKKLVKYLMFAAGIVLIIVSVVIRVVG